MQLPEPDYSLLDRPEILQRLFYPRSDRSPAPPGAIDHLVEVAAGICLACRFYRLGQAAPTILFFHGNGEVVGDYDYVAPIYGRAGINLFVAEYRGYGTSDGEPSFSAMLQDSHRVLAAFSAILASEGYSAARYVMGRSLGSVSAIELAAMAGGELSGLIIESGSAGATGWRRWVGLSDNPAKWEELQRLHLAKVRSITLPLLQIHGERDELVPLANAAELQSLVGSSEKQLVVIPGAGHNDLGYVGMKQYFEAIKAFVGL